MDVWGINSIGTIFSCDEKQAQDYADKHETGVIYFFAELTSP